MPTILMTGGHSGLGFVGARTLAGRFACNLILAGRNPERLEAAAERLRTETGAEIATLEMDLNSLASVRAGVASLKARLASGSSNDGGLKGIVCNAGAQFHGPVSYSVDGYEETFASNCLGHFLLVNLLLDRIEPDGRVVWTASGTHDPASMDGRSVGAGIEPDAFALAQQGKTEKAVSGGRRYATSKLCTILYAYELDRRLRRAGTPISSIAYDPGFLPEIGVGRMAPSIFRSSVVKLVLRSIGLTMGQMPLSGEALGMLAAGTDYAAASGKYFQSKNRALGEARSSMMSYDEAKAVQLWSASEALVRLQSSERPNAIALNR